VGGCRLRGYWVCSTGAGVGHCTQVSTADRRTVAELLAESDALARETLLDATLEHAPAMVRSWNQLVGSAVKLWTVLPSEPNNASRADPMEQLRVIGKAVGRSVTTGHWPGHGATDEHLTQIADNLSRARHLVDYPSQLTAAAPATRLKIALAAWEVQAHRSLAAVRIRLIWCGWPACRRS
jgi:hypothetical protein